VRPRASPSHETHRRDDGEAAVDPSSIESSSQISFAITSLSTHGRHVRVARTPGTDGRDDFVIAEAALSQN
jgi:hypothetical protein